MFFSQFHLFFGDGRCSVDIPSTRYLGNSVEDVWEAMFDAN